MPAATVGAAYSEPRHIYKTSKNYEPKSKKRYEDLNVVKVLGKFSGLEYKVLKKQED